MRRTEVLEGVRLMKFRDVFGTIAILSRGDGPSVAPEGVKTITTRRVDVSSTEIRGRVAAGLPIRGFVAESVEHFIFTAKLYASSRG